MELSLPKGKTLVMFSGGMDSTILLHAACKANPGKTAALFMDFGQDATRRQREYAAKTCTELNVPIHYADAPQIVNLFLGTSRPPHILQTEHMDDEQVMASEGATAFAAFAAERLGFDQILHGLTTTDLKRWPTVDFFEMSNAMNALLKSCCCKTRYSAPYIENGFTNEDVLQYAIDQGLIHQETWSCIWGYRYHCGECNACKKRKTVYGAAPSNVRDNTEYAKPWPHEVAQ